MFFIRVKDNFFLSPLGDMGHLMLLLSFYFYLGNSFECLTIISDWLSIKLQFYWSGGSQIPEFFFRPHQSFPEGCKQAVDWSNSTACGVLRWSPIYQSNQMEIGAFNLLQRRHMILVTPQTSLFHSFEIISFMTTPS